MYVHMYVYIRKVTPNHTDENTSLGVMVLAGICIVLCFEFSMKIVVVTH